MNEPSSDSILPTLFRGRLLVKIPDQIVDEGNELRIPVEVDSAWPRDSMPRAFHLEPGFPEGMIWNDAERCIVWTPREAQGPGEYSITIVATFDDPEASEMRETFRVTVRKVNTAPTIEPVAAAFDQARWAEHFKTPVVIENSIGMRLAFIPPGEFLMGSPDDDSSAWAAEKPQHTVRITKPFYLGVTEVTQEQYERVMGTNPSQFKGAEVPVERVSWEDVMEFCRRLSALPAEQSAGRVYRLPSEAEWEYACRAGSKTKWSFGDDESQLQEYAWYSGNSSRRTHPVGHKKPNAWGLYDMHGNVYEWCSDWWMRDYTTTAVIDPTGPARGSGRVYRGGSWGGVARICRSAYRYGFVPSYRGGFLGFRLAGIVSSPSR